MPFYPLRGTQVENGVRYSPIRVLVLMASRLDCDALVALFTRKPEQFIVSAVRNFEDAAAQCSKQAVDILLMDPKVTRGAVRDALTLTAIKAVAHVVFLDERPCDTRVAAVLAHREISYVTRQAGFGDLAEAIRKIAVDRGRVFDPDVANRLHMGPQGLQLRSVNGTPSVATLTDREREVMRLLAEGMSVRQCATQLELANSTVDNHKSRLMKKLGIHKATDITRVAIRDGLIIP